MPPSTSYSYRQRPASDIGDSNTARHHVSQGARYIIRRETPKRKRIRSEIRIGIILAVLGVPIALVTAILQNRLTEKEPTVTARYIAQNDGGRSVVYPGGHASSGPITADMGCAGNAVKNGAIDFQETPVRIEITGVEGRTVAIEDIRARKMDSRPATTGTVITCRGEGGAATTNIGLDLDEQTPRALQVVRDRGEGGNVFTHQPYFKQKYLYLENQKPEILLVTAFAQENDYYWDVEVVGTVDGKPRTWVLKNGDKPFHTAGRRPVKSYKYYAIRGFPPDSLQSSNVFPPPPDRSR